MVGRQSPAGARKRCPTSWVAIGCSCRESRMQTSRWAWAVGKRNGSQIMALLRIVMGKQGKQRILSSKLGILSILILVWMFCQEASGMNQKQWSNPSCRVMIQVVCPVGSRGQMKKTVVLAISYRQTFCVKLCQYLGWFCSHTLRNLVIWLVVWNMAFIFPYIGKNIPN